MRDCKIPPVSRGREIPSHFGHYLTSYYYSVLTNSCVSVTLKGREPASVVSTMGDNPLLHAPTLGPNLQMGNAEPFLEISQLIVGKLVNHFAVSSATYSTHSVAARISTVPTT